MFGQPQGNRVPPELVVQDSGGDIIGARIAFSAIEVSDVLGVIGPLQEGALSEVADRVQGRLAIISPTSPVVPDGSTGVYSLSSADPGGARALARYAISSDLYTAVVVYPENTDGLYEARAFSDVFQSEGGLILGEISYPTGSTFFEEQLRQAEALLPDVLVLPLPARDVELMAPQVIFFGARLFRNPRIGHNRLDRGSHAVPSRHPPHERGRDGVPTACRGGVGGIPAIRPSL